MMTLCLNLDGLTPVAPLPLTGPLIAVIGVCLIAAVALITVSVALARRSRERRFHRIMAYAHQCGGGSV